MSSTFNPPASITDPSTVVTPSNYPIYPPYYTGSGASGASTYARRFPTMRELGLFNPTGKKLRGMVTTTPIVGPYANNGNGALAVQWPAMKAAGINLVRIGINWTGLSSGATTVAQVVSTLAGQCASAAQYGIAVYGEIGDVGDLATYTAASDISLAQQAIAAACAVYQAAGNCIGLDLQNEVNQPQGIWPGPSYPNLSSPSTAQQTYCAAVVSAAKGATSLPITFSMNAANNNRLGNPQGTDGWMAFLMTLGLDFIDFHPYYTGTADVTASDIAALLNGTWVAGTKGLPILMGEVGQYAAADQSGGGGAAQRITNVGNLISIPGVAGAIAFSTDDYASGQAWGYWNSTSPMTERPLKTWPLRTWPKTESPTVTSRLVVLTPAALTTSAAAVGNTFPLDATGTAGVGDPAVRLVAEVTGATAGDSVSLQLTDATSGAVYASATGTVPATVPDSGPNNVAVTSLGPAPTYTPDTVLYTAVTGEQINALGNAASLGGSSAISAGTGFDWQHAWSYHAYINRQTASNGIVLAGAMDLKSGGQQIWFVYIDSSTGYVTLWFNGTPNNGASITLSQNQWHELWVDWDGSTCRAYIDGTIAAAVGAAAFTAAVTVPLTIGAASNSANSPAINTSAPYVPFTGYIDEVAVFAQSFYSGGTFSPPAAPFSATTSNIKLLLHLDGPVPVKLATPWVYQGVPVIGQAKAANTTAARGTLTGAVLETRYSG